MDTEQSEALGRQMAVIGVHFFAEITAEGVQVVNYDLMSKRFDRRRIAAAYLGV